MERNRDLGDMAKSICIPLSISFDKTPLIKQEECSLENCIDKILDLIIFTPRGSFSGDPEFGLEYWNHEFSNINIREFNNSYIRLISTAGEMNEISRRECEESIRNSIMTYEPRLHHPTVKIGLNPCGNNQKKQQKSKYEMHITITGDIDDGLGVCRQYEKRFFFMVEPLANKIIF